MASKDLPEDIMVEILARLPVKSLTRFKRLSKSASALITSSYFINKHFKFSSEVARNQHALLITRYLKEYPRNPWMIFISDETLDDPIELELPIEDEDDFYDTAVHGPCNGIFCIYRSYSFAKQGQLILWNPATREAKALPSPHNQPIKSDILFIHGFGFDPKTNDYKVVSISATMQDAVTLFNDEPSSSVTVYNLSSNSWRTIAGVNVSPFDLGTPKFNSYLNGVYHWKNLQRYGNTIICFDISKEIFWKIEIPCFKSCYLEWQVAVIDDSVACVTGPTETDLYEIWIMNEYGVKESWTRKYKLVIDFSPGFCDDNLFHTDQGPRWLASYYPRIKQKEQGFLIYVSVLFQAVRYAESLFSLPVLE
ncbi:hypothetical protein L6164_025272 [Bauhinia variegata]|uniref:Uncharacterized protein n=1 Tax=Bauhinia variegata TaxID=167791 RepID=A0ACB9M0H1_BAUVA|nr:hypothetical protein L6164_025272 [Bauhinia variegata]